MSLESFLQTMVFGVFVGGIYGIAAMGLALVFGVLKMMNIAHGELLMLGGYVSFWAFATWGIDPFVSLLLTIPALFLVGLLLDRVVYRHIVRLEVDRLPLHGVFLSTGERSRAGSAIGLTIAAGVRANTLIAGVQARRASASPRGRRRSVVVRKRAPSPLPDPRHPPPHI